MGFGVGDTLTEVLHQKLLQAQADGQIVLPAELVRRVKAGPGPGSLGQAEQVATGQSDEQAALEADTLQAISRMESAWTGQGGEAARGGLRPLADVATTASTAMGTSGSTLTDQSHAFQTTRDSLQDIEDFPPSKSFYDRASPWDTDTEDAVNQHNAAQAQNQQIYDGFTGTSDTHAASYPIDYGQIGDNAMGGFSLAPPPGTDDPGRRGGVDIPEVSGTGNNPGTMDPTSRPGGTAPSWTPPAGPDPAGPRPDSYVPAAHDNSTRAAGYNPAPPGTVPPGFGPTGTGPHAPNPSTQFGPGAGYVPGRYPGSTGTPGGRPPGAPGGGRFGGPGAGSPGGNNPGGMRGGMPGGPGAGTGGPGTGGRVTGAMPGGPGDAGGRGGAGGTGPGGSGGGRGAGGGGMPMGGAGGKGKGGEDDEHKRASYLQEADPHAIFGYDGRATPPVIGK